MVESNIYAVTLAHEVSDSYIVKMASFERDTPVDINWLQGVSLLIAVHNVMDEDDDDEGLYCNHQYETTKHPVAYLQIGSQLIVGLAKNETADFELFKRVIYSCIIGKDDIIAASGYQKDVYFHN